MSYEVFTSQMCGAILDNQTVEENDRDRLLAQIHKHFSGTLRRWQQRRWQRDADAPFLRVKSNQRITDALSGGAMRDERERIDH
jgi:hypothetical protein